MTMDKSSMRGGSIIRKPDNAGAVAVHGQTDAEGVETVVVAPGEEAAEFETDPIEHNGDGSITVHLQHPLQRPPMKGKDVGEGVDKIVLRELTAGDMVDMDKTESDTGKLASLAAALSSTPLSLILRLHYEDFAVVHAVLNEKLGKFLAASARVSSRLRVG